MNIEKLAVKHPYYCSESNYYSNDAKIEYDNLREFLNEFKDSDIDMNLCFRWDVKKRDFDDFGDDDPGLKKTTKYYAEIFLMQQRKGLFTPIIVNNVHEKDIPEFVEYLEKHWNRIQQLWNPINRIQENNEY